MTMQVLTSVTNASANSVPLQDAAVDIWDQKYRLRDHRGEAVDADPGTSATLTIPGSSAQRVIGIDVLHGFEQELITEIENSSLVIRNLLVRDYALLIKLIDTPTP